MSRILHIVWAPNVGPIAAYRDPSLAYTHARSILGVDVTPCEERDQLPPVVRDDLASAEFEEGDTPVMGVDEIPDAKPQ